MLMREYNGHDRIVRRSLYQFAEPTSNVIRTIQCSWPMSERTLHKGL